MFLPLVIQIPSKWEFTTAHVYTYLKTVGIIVDIVLHSTILALPSSTIYDPVWKLFPHRKAWAQRLPIVH